MFEKREQTEEEIRAKKEPKQVYKDGIEMSHD